MGAHELLKLTCKMQIAASRCWLHISFGCGRNCYLIQSTYIGHLTNGKAHFSEGSQAVYFSRIMLRFMLQWQHWKRMELLEKFSIDGPPFSVFRAQPYRQLISSQQSFQLPCLCSVTLFDVFFSAFVQVALSMTFLELNGSFRVWRGVVVFSMVMKLKKGTYFYTRSCAAKQWQMF